MKYLLFLSLTIIFLLILDKNPLQSLPSYTARSSRVCDSCHVSPFKNNSQEEWKNPVWYKRKCTLSCQVCHINPGGGGLRTPAGRYYANNVLPMFGSNKRPFHDTNGTFYYIFHKKSFPSDKTSSKNINYKSNNSNNKSELHKLKFFYSGDFLAFGYPFNATTKDSQSSYAFESGRYDDKNADPLLTIGVDTRPGFVRINNKSSFVFMQLDTGIAFHPIEHLSFIATVGFPIRELNTGKKIHFNLQNASLLIHELPMMMTIQMGLFLPSFGIRHEDHTAPSRYLLDMDFSRAKNIVLGTEISIAPNYPYLTLAFFTNRKHFINNSFAGYGGTITSGWRDIYWGAGVSFIYKDRPIDDGGNLRAGGINAYFSFWKWKLPIIILLEGNLGKNPKSFSDFKTFITTFSRIEYLLTPGLNLQINHHYLLNDTMNKIEEYNRLGVGFDFHIIYGVKLSSELRWTLTNTRNTSTDLILLFHGYL